MFNRLSASERLKSKIMMKIKTLSLPNRLKWIKTCSMYKLFLRLLIRTIKITCSIVMIRSLINIKMESCYPGLLVSMDPSLRILEMEEP